MQPVIMIVDDDPHNMHVLTEALKSEYELIVALDGETALNLIKEGETPDLILLDVMMPGINGFDLCQRIHQFEHLASTPVIFISALTDSDYESHGLSIGAVDYINKPFKLSSVRARIQAHLHWQASFEKMAAISLTQQKRITDIQHQSADIATNPDLDIYQKIFSNASEGIVITDPEGLITLTNDAFKRITGYSIDEVQHRHINLLDIEASPDFLHETLRKAKLEGYWSGELYSRRKDGKIYPELRTISAVHDTDGELLSYVIVINDITTLKQNQAKIEHLTWHDALTDLPNRTLLLERLESTLRYCTRHQMLTSLMIVDIKNFKMINDSKGTTVGDHVLKQMAERISRLIAEDDTLARLGSDEFALLLSPSDHDIAASSRRASEIVEQIHESMQTPFSVNHEPPMTLSCTIGIVLFPSAEETEHAHSILQHADTAHHQAKNKGLKTLFFNDKIGRQARERFALETALQTAIHNEQLRLYLQPQYDNRCQITGFEALVRWQHPEQGLLLPGRFIPIAEQSGLIIDLERWVLKQALMAQQQMSPPQARYPISVNISAKHFATEDFIATISELLSETQANPGLLVLEITESLVIENLEAVVEKMDVLTQIGIQFSIDDFGTGYSSLVYLRKLPIAEVKIDRSFIASAPNDAVDAEIVAMIHKMADFLNLRTVAEGVETQEHVNFLSEHFPNMLHQGFFYSRPQPIQQILDQLTQQTLLNST